MKQTANQSIASFQKRSGLLPKGPKLSAGLILVLFVTEFLGPFESNSTAGVQIFRALPSGTKRPPVKPAVRVDLLEMEMRAEGAPAWVRPGMFRVAGVIQSIGTDGVLLTSAGAVSWMEVAAEANGNLTTTLVPGAKINPREGLLFVRGVHGKVGELVTVDAVRAGNHIVQIGGRAMQVFRFRNSTSN